MWIILAIFAFYIGLYIGDKSKFDMAFAPVKWFCATVVELFSSVSKSNKPTDKTDHDNR